MWTLSSTQPIRSSSKALECAGLFMQPRANNYTPPVRNYMAAALETLKLHPDSVFKLNIFFMQSDHDMVRTFHFWRLATDEHSTSPRLCPYVLLLFHVLALVFTAWTKNWRQIQPCVKYAIGCTVARIWTAWIWLFLRSTYERTSGYTLIGGRVLWRLRRPQ